MPVPRELTVSLLLANLRACIRLRTARDSNANAAISRSDSASPEHIAELRKRADSNALAVLNLSYRVALPSDSASLMSAVTMAASYGGLQACECTAAAAAAASSLGASPLPTWRASIEICAPAERLFDRVLRERPRWDAECFASQVLVELTDCADVVRLALLDACSINPLTLLPMQREYILLRYTYSNMKRVEAGEGDEREAEKLRARREREERERDGRERAEREKRREREKCTTQVHERERCMRESHTCTRVRTKQREKDEKREREHTCTQVRRGEGVLLI